MEASVEVTNLIEESRAFEIAGNYSQALETAQQALERAREQNDCEGIARALTCLGFVHYRLGNYAECRELAEQALALTGEVSKARIEALLLLGVYAMEQDALDDMESYCYQAAELCRVLGEEEARYRALHNLSQVYALRGQFDLLIAADEEAYRIAHKLNLPQQAIPLISMAFVYIRTRQPSHAKELIEKIDHYQQASLSHKGYNAMLRGMLGLLEEDYPSALAHYTEARSIAEEIGDPALHIFVRMGVSRYHRLTGNPCNAMEWAEDAVAWANRHQNRRMLGRTLIERGYAAWALGDSRRAKQDLQDAIEELGKRQQWYDQAYAKLLLAALFYKEQNLQSEAFWLEAVEFILNHGYTHLLDQERAIIFPIITAYLDHPDAKISKLSSLCIEHLKRIPPQPLMIRTLGNFEVRQGGRQISSQAWRHRRAGELFRLLLISPRRCLNREQIMEALWPDKPAASAKMLLHQATSALRHVLEPDLPERFPSRYLQVEEGYIELCLPTGSWVDFEQFEQEVRAENWEAAIKYYQDVLYPQDLYAEWAAPYRERLSSLYLRALLVLAHRYSKNNKARETIDICRKILEIDPWQEEAVFLGMQAHLVFNDRCGAMRLYHQLEQTLRDELGIEPNAQLRELYQSLK